MWHLAGVLIKKKNSIVDIKVFCISLQFMSRINSFFSMFCSLYSNICSTYEQMFPYLWTPDSWIMCVIVGIHQSKVMIRHAVLRAAVIFQFLRQNIFCLVGLQKAPESSLLDPKVFFCMICSLKHFCCLLFFSQILLFCNLFRKLTNFKYLHFVECCCSGCGNISGDS